MLRDSAPASPRGPFSLGATLARAAVLGCRCGQICMCCPTTSLATAAGSEAFFWAASSNFWAMSPKRDLLDLRMRAVWLARWTLDFGPSRFSSGGAFFLREARSALDAVAAWNFFRYSHRRAPTPARAILRIKRHSV